VPGRTASGRERARTSRRPSPSDTGRIGPTSFDDQLLCALEAFGLLPCRLSAKTRQRGWLGYPYPYRSRDWASSNSPFSFLTPTLVHRPLQRAFTCSGPEAVVDRSAGNSARLRAGRAALAEQELGPVEHCCPDHLGGAEIDDPLMLDA